VEGHVYPQAPRGSTIPAFCSSHEFCIVFNLPSAPWQFSDTILILPLLPPWLASYGKFSFLFAGAFPLLHKQSVSEKESVLSLVLEIGLPLPHPFFRLICQMVSSGEMRTPRPVLLLFLKISKFAARLLHVIMT
jgi:hypothetical protein